MDVVSSVVHPSPPLLPDSSPCAAASHVRVCVQMSVSFFFFFVCWTRRGSLRKKKGETNPNGTRRKVYFREAAAAAAAAAAELMMMRRLFRLLLWECDAVYRHQCLSESGGDTGDVYRRWNYYTTSCEEYPLFLLAIVKFIYWPKTFRLFCFVFLRAAPLCRPCAPVSKWRIVIWTHTNERTNQLTDGLERERPRSMTTARL